MRRVLDLPGQCPAPLLPGAQAGVPAGPQVVLGTNSIDILHRATVLDDEFAKTPGAAGR